ncbi:Hypothetical predicted protein, partial [Pelobates cultripes]
MEFDKEVKRWLAFYEENPPMEIIQATLAQVDAFITANEDQENKLWMAEQRAFERLPATTQ